eukprot:3187496-Pyramimonas_sp.AAC.1
MALPGGLGCAMVRAACGRRVHATARPRPPRAARLQGVLPQDGPGRVQHPPRAVGPRASGWPSRPG